MAPHARPPLIQSYHPTTFIERGVHVPFTTPALAGARARAGTGAEIEMVVPSPGGGRGIYILPWLGLPDFCRMTRHDARLVSRVASLRVVTPAAMRAAVRAVAAEGLAGREAKAAAGKAHEAATQVRTVVGYRLLLKLIGAEGVDGPMPASTPGATEARARSAVARLARRIGRPQAAVADALEGLAGAVSAAGLAMDAAPDTASCHAGGRIARIADALARLKSDMARWAARHEEDDSSLTAEMVAAAADLTRRCLEITVQRAQAGIAEIGATLGQWCLDPAATAEIFARPDWLADGWEPICALWDVTQGEGARRAVLTEVAAMLPVIPREAAGWIGIPLDVEAPGRLRRVARVREDWRNGMMLPCNIGRLEAARALMLRREAGIDA